MDSPPRPLQWRCDCPPDRCSGTSAGGKPRGRLLPRGWLLHKPQGRPQRLQYEGSFTVLVSRLVLKDLAALHNENNPPQSRNVLERIARDSDHVGLHPGRKRTNFIPSISRLPGKEVPRDPPRQRALPPPPT